MKLVKKTNTYYLIFLVLIFPVMITVDYYLIRYLVNLEVEEVLLHERDRIEFQLREKGNLPTSSYVLDTMVLKQVSGPVASFGDTIIYEAYAKKTVPYRTYTFNTEMDTETVQIRLKHVLLEINELIWLLFIATSFIILLLFLGLFFINRSIYRWAWSPFFNNLTKLKNHNIIQTDAIQLEPSSITEFQELNQVITALMEQVRKDFQNLKEFNENISHEIQTPLAIIRNKVVLLMESTHLDKKDQERVQAIYQETNKLSKIGKALTLISRIENQEFKRSDAVDVHIMVGNILSNMEEIIKFKELEVSVAISSTVMECDHILADILLTNLIKNAVEHNVQGGMIQIVLEDGSFKIYNTGEMPEVASEKLFDRFQRGKAKTDSLGLGLAINQKICEIYGFKLEYEQVGEMHIFSLFFSPSNQA
ncbi:Histidine kinase [Croceitalea dokdonensis DOKDO 023]|uniref:histidine kinase n=1 Tax=Croceitalea dokdonensis DOKDO 023 TaxID=1300341 RepID=A0A0P7A357_9FLAO|nr:HAMP domain-containing sensor histidine kinase [Croceitalea dokdonensis]KPM30885.1 Histidine kinase [Croceitalea dokdonensis DOKDO 023]